MAKLYANTTGVVRWSGGTIILEAGKTTADPDHPLVLERPDLWTDDEPEAKLRSPLTSPRGVERATQAPGEKRGRGRPKLPRDGEGNVVRD